jgi:capsular exopolysaccharide synthesis family protein
MGRGRIEEALRKLADQRERAGAAAPPAAATRSVAPAPNSEGLRPFSVAHAARTVDLSLQGLKRRGSTALLEGNERAKQEYGRIKRPLIDRARGRTADPGPSGAPATTIIVTSAMSGEGKSVTAWNLAISIAAEKDLSVLLIDADTVKPDLSTMLGLGQTRGLTDLLSDDSVQFADVVWKMPIDRLYCIAAGTHRSGATELLGSERMRAVADMLSELHDTIVVFDSSPLLLTNESPVLAAIAGQIVFVVRANETSRLLVAEALERLDPTKPIGLVLNGANAAQTTYYGAYGGVAAAGSASVGGADAPSSV